MSRSLIAQLRCSVLPITIDIGKYTKKPKETDYVHCVILPMHKINSICRSLSIISYFTTNLYHEAIAIKANFCEFTVDDIFFFLLTE